MEEVKVYHVGFCCDYDGKRTSVSADVAAKSASIAAVYIEHCSKYQNVEIVDMSLSTTRYQNIDYQDLTARLV